MRTAILSISLLVGLCMPALGITVTVDAHSGPWDWDPDINPMLAYGIRDHTDPSIVAVNPGDTVLIDSATGLVRAGSPPRLVSHRTRRLHEQRPRE